MHFDNRLTQIRAGQPPDLFTVERVINFRKRTAEAGTNLAKDRNEGDADKSSDQAVFDGRCARLIVHETRKDVHWFVPIYANTFIDPVPRKRFVLAAELTGTVDWKN